MRTVVVFSCISLVIYMWACLSFDWYSGGLALVWTIRVLYTRHNLIIGVSLFMIVVAMGRVYSIRSISQLAVEQTEFQVFVPSHTIKINGDVVTGEGYSNNELVSFSYKCQTKEEKYFFEQLEDDITIHALGQLKPYETASFPHLFHEKNYYFQYKRSFHKLHINQYTVLKKHFNVIMRWKKQISRIIKGHLWQYVNTLVFGQVDETAYFEPFHHLGVLFLFIFSGLHVKWLLKSIQYVLLRAGILVHYTNRLLWGISLGMLMLYGFKIGVIKQLLFILFPKHSRLFLLALLTIALVLYNPFLIYHTAFHYAILMSAFYYVMPKKRIIYSWLVLLSSYHYFQLNIIGISLTTIMTKLVQWLLLPIAWLSAIVPHAVFNTSNIVLEWLHSIIMQFSQLKWAVIVTGRQAFYWYVGCVVIIVLLGMKTSKKWQGTLCILFCLMLCPKPADRFIMIDVGQGDSLLFQSGYHVVMVDTGGSLSFEQKEKWRQRTKRFTSDFNILPLLKSLGIGKIDAIICSHADSDHVGELTHIQNKLEVKQVISATGAPISQTTRHVLANDVITVGKLRFDVLYPFVVGNGKNEHSIVLYTTFLQKRWLLTGDIGKESEQKLIKKYANLSVDVLKVGHHGSKYSSSESFLRHIKAKISLISVGENNTYQHPHDDVLKRLMPTIIYRTDEHGTVLFDGDKWHIGKVIR